MTGVSSENQLSCARQKFQTINVGVARNQGDAPTSGEKGGVAEVQSSVLWMRSSDLTTHAPRLRPGRRLTSSSPVLLHL
eukprot:m.278904 g.278904  ORF g.278904 m.278904 type:complete len:79 (-) comp26959_c0_seq1:1790-2026(-)